MKTIMQKNLVWTLILSMLLSMCNVTSVLAEMMPKYTGGSLSLVSVGSAAEVNAQSIVNSVSFNYPTDGNMVLPNQNLTVRWDAVDTVSYYLFSLVKINGSQTLINNAQTSRNSYSISGSDLVQNSQFEIRVDAFDESGVQVASGSIVVYTDEAEALTINTPRYGEVVEAGSNLRVSWDAVSGADLYKLSLRNADTEQLVFHHVETTKSYYIIDASQLEANTHYSLWVGAFTNSGVGLPNSTIAFEVGEPAVVVPTVVVTDVDISPYRVTVHAKVTDDGGARVTEYGIYEGSYSFEYSDKHTASNISSNGSFSYTLSQSECFRRLELRVYAKNEAGIGKQDICVWTPCCHEHNSENYSELESVTYVDIDSDVYHEVRDEIWRESVICVNDGNGSEEASGEWEIRGMGGLIGGTDTFGKCSEEFDYKLVEKQVIGPYEKHEYDVDGVCCYCEHVNQSDGETCAHNQLYTYYEEDSVEYVQLIGADRNTMHEAVVHYTAITTYCADCGEESTEYVEGFHRYKEDHSFYKDQNTKCIYCDYKLQCTHSDMVFVGSIPKDLEIALCNYNVIDDKCHLKMPQSDIVFARNLWQCNDCEVYFYKSSDGSFESALGSKNELGADANTVESHEFVNNVCIMCKYERDVSKPIVSGFTMSPNPVEVGVPVSFRVTAPNAVKIALYADGVTYGDEYEVTNGVAEFTRAFSQAGERKIQFKAYADGEWSELCSAQTLTVRETPAVAPAIVSVVIDPANGVLQLEEVAVFTVTTNAATHSVALNVYAPGQSGNDYTLIEQAYYSDADNGNRIFKLRYLPDVTGEHQVKIIAKDENGSSVAANVQWVTLRVYDCAHANAELQIMGKKKYIEHVARDAEEHDSYYVFEQAMVCPDCGTIYDRQNSERMHEVNPHTLKNGICEDCEYNTNLPEVCTHKNVRSIESKRTNYMYFNAENHIVQKFEKTVIVCADCGVHVATHDEKLVSATEEAHQWGASYETDDGLYSKCTRPACGATKLIEQPEELPEEHAHIWSAVYEVDGQWYQQCTVAGCGETRVVDKPEEEEHKHKWMMKLNSGWYKHPLHMGMWVCTDCGQKKEGTTTDLLYKTLVEKCCECSGHRWTQLYENGEWCYYCVRSGHYATDEEEFALLLNESIDKNKNPMNDKRVESFVRGIFSLNGNLNDKELEYAINCLKNAPETHRNLFLFTLVGIDITTKNTAALDPVAEFDRETNTVIFANGLPVGSPGISNGDIAVHFHEIAHYMDYNAPGPEGLYGYVVLNYEILDLIESDIRSEIYEILNDYNLSENQKELIFDEMLGSNKEPIGLDKNLSDIYYEALDKLEEELDGMLTINSVMVQDVYSGSMNNKIGKWNWGMHRADGYWYNDDGSVTGAQCKEAFAEYFAAQIMQDKHVIDLNKKYFEETCEYFDGLCEEMLDAYIEKYKHERVNSQ